MPRISVITPTVRLGGLAIVAKSLQRQTFQDFEWLIGSKEIIPIQLDATWVQDDFKGGFWTFNRTVNKLFETAKGELIVSWQDWIHVPPDGLQKFWDAYEQTKGEALLTGVGDQYETTDSRGKPSVKIWFDPRRTTKYGSFYECTFPDIEWNWGAIPKKLWEQAGGLDEQLDFLGYDGATYQMAERLNEMGVKFFIDQDNESFTVRHDRSAHGGQDNWDKNHTMFNGAYEKRYDELKKKGQWPVLIDFGR